MTSGFLHSTLQSLRQLPRALKEVLAAQPNPSSWMAILSQLRLPQHGQGSSECCQGAGVLHRDVGEKQNQAGWKHLEITHGSVCTWPPLPLQERRNKARLGVFYHISAFSCSPHSSVALQSPWRLCLILVFSSGSTRAARQAGGKSQTPPALTTHLNFCSGKILTNSRHRRGKKTNQPSIWP